VTAQTQLMQNWILTALGTEGVATNLSPQEKSKFLSLLCTKIVKDKRKFKSLLNDFSQVCNHQLASDVFLSYEL
jgi:hypothetical protein